MFNDGNGMEYPYSSSIPAKLPSFTDVVGTGQGTSPSGSAPAFSVGKIGKAFKFDGINDYIALPNNSLLFTNGGLTTPIDYSLSVWVYLTDITNYQQIVSSLGFGPTGYNYGWELLVSQNKVKFLERYGSSQNPIEVTVTANNWHHIVATRVHQPNTQGVQKMYLNGSLISTIIPPNNRGIEYDQLPATTQIGCSRFAGGIGTGVPNWFIKNGSKIDAVSVWSKTLTATEVSDLYNSGNGKQYPNY
jgi:hypothetical protein